MNLINDLMVIVAFCTGALVGITAVSLIVSQSLNRRSDFGAWLGMPCWIRNPYRKGKRWRKYRVVAVSHKGGIAVRKWDDESGHHAFWIDKERVPERVRFCDIFMIGAE